MAQRRSELHDDNNGCGQQSKKGKNIRQSKTFLIYSPSGSQSLVPSSSNDVNLACNEEAATIRLVEESNKMLEYARPRSIDLEGSVLLN